MFIVTKVIATLVKFMPKSLCCARLSVYQLIFISYVCKNFGCRLSPKAKVNTGVEMDPFCNAKVQ